MPNDAPLNPDEKKLYVDEDWKSKVEAEKAAAEGQAAEPTVKEPPTAPLPPPSLTFLAGTLYLQGAISMGLLPNPVADKSDLQLDRAKHAIDMLAMLQQKTEGNRTPDESEEIEALLHELRMAYVSFAK